MPNSLKSPIDYASDEVLAMAPAEYTDWEKRIWRRGYVDALSRAPIAEGGGK